MHFPLSLVHLCTLACSSKGRKHTLHPLYRLSEQCLLGAPPQLFEGVSNFAQGSFPQESAWLLGVSCRAKCKGPAWSLWPPLHSLPLRESVLLVRSLLHPSLAASSGTGWTFSIFCEARGLCPASSLLGPHPPFPLAPTPAPGASLGDLWGMKACPPPTWGNPFHLGQTDLSSSLAPLWTCLPFPSNPTV